VSAAERTMYRETYKKGTTIRADRLPETRHTNGMQPVEARLLAAGVVQRGDTKLEYQDIRLYFAPDAPTRGEG
jgi:hypothetical protein